MGNDFSTDLSAVDKLCGPDAIPFNDPFWVDELECLQLDLESLDPEYIDLALRGWCENIARYNTKSGNMCTLIKTLIVRLQVIGKRTHDTHQLSEADGICLLNLLFLVRLFLKYMIESYDVQFIKSQFVIHTEGGPNTPKNQRPSAERYVSLPVQLARAIVDAVIDFPLMVTTFDLHLELLYVFISVCSTQMYLPLELDSDDVFINAFMNESCHTRAQEFTHALLKRIVLRNESADEHVRKHQEGMLERLTGVVASIFWLPVRIFHYFFPVPPKHFPLSQHAALSLLIISHQRPVFYSIPDSDQTSRSSPGTDMSERKTRDVVVNPYAKSIEQLRDADMGGFEDDDDGFVFRISFRELYECLSGCLTYESSSMLQEQSREWGVLLLYAFLHHNKSFRDFLFSRSDLDEIILPLCRKLYHEEHLSGNATYMLLIVMLILSEDSAFCETIHKHYILEEVPWVKEVILHDISLGSLAIVVLLHTISRNLTTEPDKYLHQNCLAVLSNMSPYARSVHGHAAQKLVHLTNLLSKRYLRLYHSLHGHSQTNDTAIQTGDMATHSGRATEAQSGSHIVDDVTKSLEKNGGGSQLQETVTSPMYGDAVEVQSSRPSMLNGVDTRPGSLDSTAIEEDVDTFGAFIRLLLEAVAHCLVPRDGLLVSNGALVYALFHGKEILPPLQSHRDLSDVVAKLQHLVDFFDRAIRDARLVSMSVENVLRVIRLSSRSYDPPIALHESDAPHHAFDYEERDNSCEFFLPYIWHVVFRTSGLKFARENIQLFDAGDYSEDDYEPTESEQITEDSLAE
eukprot:782316_1